MEIKLDGKVALVTGGGKGIGRAIALRLARSGAHVAVNYHRSQAGAEKISEEIRKMGLKSIAIQADVSISSQVNQMVDQVIETFDGRLDILINNAGLAPFKEVPTKEVVNMTDEEWNQIVDTNLKGAFYVSRAAARVMIKRGTGGRIIGIASGAGHSGRHGQAHYCASKAGLILLCKTLAIELAHHNINVNSISLGFVDLGYYESSALRSIKESMLRRILLHRPGKAEDIANMAAFLASEQANWITGTDFLVDGGESTGRIPEEEAGRNE